MKQYLSGIRSFLLIFALNGALRLQAADTAAATSSNPNAGETARVVLSGTTIPKKAPWQQRLTLGPGDVLNISLFDVPESAHRDVPVGPDGRISFLQARDVLASGLTIDELRVKLDEGLAKFYQNARTVITPSAFHSKKYFVLGAVASKGVFSFDRPITIIEAIARAGGLETGLFDARTVELADLSHSFLVRNGQRVPVDFEHLFQQGDLAQNIPLEPDDYLFFASADANQIYVLGEVAVPGVMVFAPKTTAITAIASRGGFSLKAFQSRVLVVRGSLNHPQTFVVNTSEILKGKERDFKLEPKDIVYVSSNPWVKAEDLLDTAARAFLQSMLVEYTTLHVGPFITQPLLK